MRAAAPHRLLAHALLIAALSALSCAQSPPGEAPPRLQDVLRLEMRVASQRQSALAPFDISLALRNVGGVPVAFCQLDSGVSISLARLNDPEVHPVAVHGIVLRPRDRCHEKTTLPPGAAKEFRETVRVRADLTGPAQLLAQIRVYHPGLLRGDSDVARIGAPALPLLIQPAASR